MKLFLCILAASATGLIAADTPDFHAHLGLQLWSLRAQMKENVFFALNIAKGYELTEIETAGTYDLPVDEFSKMLKAFGFKVVSAHIGYEILKKDLPGAIRDAKALGAQFLICPILPHGKEGIDEATAHRVAAEFNAWGAACRAAGLRFGYHPHGIEFRAIPGGKGETPFDVLVRETKPELVCYEMDVFWVFHAGQDPAKLLYKYPDRWALMHIKDIRKGAATGFSTGSAPPADNVPVGDGQINWGDVLRAARDIHVEHYFIEDETVSPLQCIPASLAYLNGLKL